MNNEFIELCPFREGTASRRLYLALARSSEPMTKAEVSRKSHVLANKTATLLAAYQNPMHKAPLDRVGVRLTKNADGRYLLEIRKAHPNAKRPPRGQQKFTEKTAKKTATRPAKLMVPIESPAESAEPLIVKSEQ